MLDRLHRHRISHLLMELRVALGRGKAVLEQQVRMVQVNRRIAAARRRIDIDDLNVFADWAWSEFVLPTYLQGGLIDSKRLQTTAERRIVGIDAQWPA